MALSRPTQFLSSVSVVYGFQTGRMMNVLILTQNEETQKSQTNTRYSESLIHAVLWTFKATGSDIEGGIEASQSPVQSTCDKGIKSSWPIQPN